MVVDSLAMRRLRHAAVLGILVLAVTMGVSSGTSEKPDLLIAVVGDQQVVGKPFAVRIKNNGEKRLTICLTACGRPIESGNGLPVPGFAVQTRARKKWSKEVLGCDPTPDSVSRILHGGEILEFSVKISQPGTYRLWLAYKEVSVEAVGAHCEAIKDGKSVLQAKSDDFDVVAAPK